MGKRMIRIAICEDEKIFRDNLIRLITEYFEEKGIEYFIDDFLRGEDLLKVSLEQYDIFCLDVAIQDGMSGIEVAKKIREKVHKSDIIFTTSHQEEAYKAFEVNTLRYLLKPVQRDELAEVLDLALKRKEERESQVLVLNQGQKFIQIPLVDILYFETLDRKLKVNTVNKPYIVDNKINELDKKLSERNFFRIHKSYLINMTYIREHDQTTVTMQNGDVVYISRLKLKAFKEKFSAFLRRKRGE